MQLTAAARDAPGPSAERGLGGDWVLAYSDAPDILGLRGGPLAKLRRIGQQVFFLSHPILPIRHSPFFLSHPILPICHSPFFLCITVVFLFWLRIGQQIDADARTIDNVIEYVPADWLRGPFVFNGVAADDSLQQRVLLSYETKGSRVDIKIRGTSIKPATVLGVNLLAAPPLTLEGALSLPFGSFELLYNDGDLRVVKTAQGYWGVNRRLPPGQGWDEL